MQAARQVGAREAHDRLDNIDALRALAVAAVVLFHYTARFPADYMGFGQPVWPVVYGFLGVDLFFIVSGYCIYMTATHCPGVAAFWIRRISRLQPAYLVAIVLTFSVVAIYGLPGREVGVLNALENMVWLNSFGAVPHVDGAYWSLLVEIKLYILFGILFFALKGRGEPILWWSLFCLLGGVIWKFDRMTTGGSISAYTASIATFVFPYSGHFLAGMLIYGWQRTEPWVRLLACAAFLVSCFGEAGDWTELAVLIAIFAVAALILSWPTLRVPRSIVFLGFVSYPLYLIHQNVGVVVIRETAGLIPSDYGRISLAILVSLALATIMSVAVEHRFRKRIEHLIGDIISSISSLPLRLRLTSAAELPRATRKSQAGED